MNHTDEEIITGVRESIADVMKIPIDEVKLDSILTEDLEAVSIDFVDIMFHLESKFQVTFHSGNPLDRIAESVGPESVIRQGALTGFGVEVVHRRMPEIVSSVVTPGMPAGNVQALYTTATWVRTVKELLEARPKSCPSCGSDSLRPLRPSILLCDGCKSEVKCPTQAEILTTWAKEEFGSPPDRRHVESRAGS